MNRPRLFFRLGTTSYIYPADILTNVQRLAEVADDIELVFFEVNDYNNFLDEMTVTKLRTIAARYGISYTVHLPLDLRLGSGKHALRHPSIEKALKVIRMTRALEPWAYITHLDGSEPLAEETPSAWEEWRKRCIQALEFLGPECGNQKLLCVENIESYLLEEILPILEEIETSLCLDVGHLWLREITPLPYLQRYLNRIRVIHMHGVAERDHKSLTCVPTDVLHALLHELYHQNYENVVTLEVFSQKDFWASRELVLQWYLYKIKLASTDAAR